jgi:hypothetical protein
MILGHWREHGCGYAEVSTAQSECFQACFAGAADEADQEPES